MKTHTSTWAAALVAVSLSGSLATAEAAPAIERPRYRQKYVKRQLVDLSLGGSLGITLPTLTLPTIVATTKIGRAHV